MHCCCCCCRCCYFYKLASPLPLLQLHPGRRISRGPYSAAPGLNLRREEAGSGAERRGAERLLDFPGRNIFQHLHPAAPSLSRLLDFPSPSRLHPGIRGDLSELRTSRESGGLWRNGYVRGENTQLEKKKKEQQQPLSKQKEKSFSSPPPRQFNVAPRPRSAGGRQEAKLCPVRLTHMEQQ